MRKRFISKVCSSYTQACVFFAELKLRFAYANLYFARTAKGFVIDGFIGV